MAAASMSIRLLRNFSSLRPSYLCRNTLERWQFMSMSTNAQAPENKQGSGGEAPPPPPANDAANEIISEIEKLEAQFKEEKEKLTKDLQESNDRYKRSLAETENVRNRMRKQVDDAKLFGIQGFCKDLLEVADILTKATESVPETELTTNAPLKNLYDGLTMTESQLLKLFTKHGLVQINPAEGEKFDPNIHEALFQQPSSEGKVSDTVAVVTKVGYALHHRTLRPALVGVYK